MAKKMTSEEMLEQVNTAIYTICVGGQSYKIGSRQLTRANLSELYSIKSDLEAAIAQSTSGCLIDNTYVAIFDGR
ncbi:MAG: peptidylprolyl isomerase [Lachnospiraceae bacterium]|nr:peptidylprolyl isomerase [Lachnospiraceae bacterium]